MAKLNKILKSLMSTQQLTETALARETEIGQPVIHRLGSGDTDNPKLATLKPIAAYFNLNISQLIHDMPLPTSALMHTYAETLPFWVKVPLLNWLEIHDWIDAPNDTHLHVARTIATTAHIDKHSYALRISDTSMAPAFPKASIVIIDPARKPQHEDYVITHTSTRLPTLKQYLLKEETVYLKSLNETFDADACVQADTDVLGVCAQIIHPGTHEVAFEA